MNPDTQGTTGQVDFQKNNITLRTVQVNCHRISNHKNTTTKEYLS